MLMPGVLHASRSTRADGVSAERPGRAYPRTRPPLPSASPRGPGNGRRPAMAPGRLGSGAMRIPVVDHPLVAHKLTTLRDRRTDSPTFRRLADELVTLLAYEATREVRTEAVDLETPVAPTTGVRLSHPKPLVVP